MKLVLTGTHAYGPAGDNSDIDIVVVHEDAVAIWSALLDLGIVPTQTEAQQAYEPEGGYYFDLGPLKINIIDGEIEAIQEKWRLATEKMRALPPIADRTARVAMFKKFFYG